MAVETPYEIDVLEGETKTYTATLLDEDSAAVPVSAVSTMELRIYSTHSGSIINSRDDIDVKNNVTYPEFTMHATSGLITLKFLAADTTIADSPKQSTVVIHRAVLKIKWNDSASVARTEIREISLKITPLSQAPA